ncbi:CMRF35-like molecule 9 [Garra rufa]|uniref:CMRF35-like molecule 9 n=1 Tax=Garra rufa TaxID=137080 RepID=UPI003CCEC185
MFSMFVVPLVFSSICTVVVGAPKTVTGHRGESFDIKCRYTSGYESNSKYFCKGKCNIGNKNIVVKSGSKDRRFSLTDNRKDKVFTVTITDLRTTDQGQYWCAVERTLPFDLSLTDVYSEIFLKVKHGNPFSNMPPYISISEVNSQSTSITITEKHKSTDLVSVAGGLGYFLLVLILCSGTFCILKKKKRKSKTALFQQNVQNNMESIHMYEITNSDPGPLIAAVASSNQMPESHLNTRPQVTTVYATVTNQQPDSNPCHTHLTNQVTDTDCDFYGNIKSIELTPDSRTELIYSQATHPQNFKTNDGLIYSEIQHK